MARKQATKLNPVAPVLVVLGDHEVDDPATDGKFPVLNGMPGFDLLATYNGSATRQDGSYEPDSIQWIVKAAGDTSPLDWDTANSSNVAFTKVSANGYTWNLDGMINLLDVKATEADCGACTSATNCNFGQTIHTRVKWVSIFGSPDGYTSVKSRKVCAFRDGTQPAQAPRKRESSVQRKLASLNLTHDVSPVKKVGDWMLFVCDARMRNRLVVKKKAIDAEAVDVAIDEVDFRVVQDVIITLVPCLVRMPTTHNVSTPWGNILESAPTRYNAQNEIWNFYESPKYAVHLTQNASVNRTCILSMSRKDPTRVVTKPGVEIVLVVNYRFPENLPVGTFRAWVRIRKPRKGKAR